MTMKAAANRNYITGGKTPNELALIAPESTPPHSVRETPIGIDIFSGHSNFHIVGGNALMRPAASFLPAPREHAFEVMEQDAEEHDEQGGPPQTDKSKDLRDSR
jgi:hypothetical protein